MYLPVKRSHRRAAPMTGSTRNRLLSILTSAIGMAKRLLPAFVSCLESLKNWRHHFILAKHVLWWRLQKCAQSLLRWLCLAVSEKQRSGVCPSATRPSVCSITSSEKQRAIYAQSDSLGISTDAASVCLLRRPQTLNTLSCYNCNFQHEWSL